MIEILKLAELLEKAFIPYSFEQFLGGYQIRVYFDRIGGKEIDDCVWHPYSHGFDRGLLESYRLNDCRGYENAEEIFEGWKKVFQNRHW